MKRSFSAPSSILLIELTGRSSRTSKLKVLLDVPRIPTSTGSYTKLELPTDSTSPN